MRTSTISGQLDLFNRPAPPTTWDDGHEHSGYYTVACVPGGFYCDQCDTIVFRDICFANEPKELGYESATWVWHYKDRRPWTDDTE